MSPRRRRALLAVAVVAAVGLGVAAWVMARTDRPSPPLAHFVRTGDYLPGVAADLYLPAATTQRTPTVVLIPGGSWRTADRRGLAPLASTLAGDGMVVVNATYRAANSGVRFPVPVADIVCAVDYAADQARVAGFVPGPVIVVGHSSGAQLSALAALNGSHFRNDCPYPPIEPDGLIGLSGPYDISNFAQIAYPLFGATAAAEPEQWRDGNPMTWVGQRTGPAPLSVLLVHGAADELVPTTATAAFAAALLQAGHPVQMTIIPDAGHADTYRPAVVTDLIVTWVRSLP